MDGIMINDIHSYRDYDLCIKSRNIGLPDKRNIRQTVPFMNGFYDFTALNGAPTWGERPIGFSFDVIADSPGELDAEVTRIQDWLCNVHDADIHDDTMRYFHWHGSFDSCDVTWEDNGLAAELAVTFVVQPFKIADEPIEYTVTTGTYTINNSGMCVAPYARSASAATIQIGAQTSITIAPNTDVHLDLDFTRGDNTVTVSGSSTVKFWYYEEVM